MVNISRTRDDGSRYHIATFTDLGHAMMYITAHMDAANEVGDDEELIITYKHEKEDAHKWQ